MSAAAKHLDTNAATVSRRVERLGNSLKTQLFIKEKDNWRPTPEAEQLAHLAGMFDESLGTYTLASISGANRPRRLKITSPLRILQLGIFRNTYKLLEANPELSLDVDYNEASLAYGEADIALSVEKPDHGRLIRRQLATVDWRVYGARKNNGDFRGWADLTDTNEEGWLNQDVLRQHFECDSRFGVNGLNLMLSVVKQTNLVAFFPSSMAARHPEIVEIDGFEPQMMQIWASYHSTRQSDQMVRIVFDWLIETTQHI